MDALLILCTCPDADSATTISRTLVEERLAACVNRIPGLTSVYRWQGQIREEGETLLLIKTVREHLEALRARLVELHPYELPEVIALEISDADASYLDWLRDQTRT